MRLLGLNIEGKTIPSRRQANPYDESYWDDQERVIRSGSGEKVTPSRAMQVAAVNACVRVIAETIASLPLILYKRTGKGSDKERATSHPLYRILHDWPNDWMTKFEWVELMVRHLLLRGNAYSQVGMKGSTIYELNPLHPDCVTPRWVSSKGRKLLVYEYSEDGYQRIFSPDQIVHLKGPTEDGIIGRGPIQETREVIGNAIALDNYQSFFFRNGARLSGVVSHPETLTDETSERISKSFREAYAGAANSGKVAVLEEGMSFTTVGINPRDAEFIAQRKFSINEIARVFRVPPHMIGDLGAATYSNIESEFISFVVHTIRPWTVRIEQALMKSLLGEDESETYFAEFLLDGLLRGDIASRYAAYQIGLQTGFLKLNEVREMENKNSLEWGEMSMIPLAMQPIQSVEDLKRLPAPTADGQTADPAAKKDDKKKDAKRPSAKKKVDEGEDEETNSAYPFEWVRERMAQSAEPLFTRAFATIAKREITLLEKVEESKDKDKAIKSSFADDHRTFVRSTLQPLIQSLSSQLCLLGEISERQTTPINDEFMAEWVKQYVDERFDAVWNQRDEGGVIEAYAEALRRRMHAERVVDFVQKIKDFVFQEKGKSE